MELFSLFDVRIDRKVVFMTIRITIIRMNTNRRQMLLCSIFFVLGFAAVFSIVGVLLQTVLSSVAPSVQDWLARIGGAIIIFFGLFLLGLVRVSFLERDYKMRVTHKFTSRYVTSFVFGAAFAVGWSPCVGAALGAILVLASTQPGSAFLLLFAYTLGIGLPFIAVGACADKAQTWIDKAGQKITIFKYLFGVLLIVVGVLMFVGELSALANFAFATELLSRLGLVSTAGGGISSISFTSLAVSFLAGIGSFLSPCVLPLVPGFLSYLAAIGAADAAAQVEVSIK